MAQVLLQFCRSKKRIESCAAVEKLRGLVRLARCDLTETMTAETLIRLLEEMMDIKMQQYAQYHLKLNPEVAKLLTEKRETDRRRLQQIRTELVRFLDS
jgi:hypothetical protein